MSLVEIEKPPPPEKAAILLNPGDDVAVARVGLPAGQRVVVAGYEVVLREAVPAGHKIALREIPAGSCLKRYGQVIGRAPGRIEAGAHVHTHNLAYEEGSREYRFPEGEADFPAPAAGGPAFQGYAREDGRAGTRNYIAVVAASNCASHVAEEVARGYRGKVLPPGVDGVVAFPHGEGCGHSIGPDTEQLRRTVWGVMDHPNVSAAVLIGLGCEVNQIDQYQGSRVVGLTLQDSGGTRGAVEAAQRQIGWMLERAEGERRVEMPAARICLGLNCGGSDSFSGITANPGLGYCSDLLIGLGGTSVLAETPEILGAEHLLVARARSRAVGERLLGMVRGYKAYLNRFGGSFDDNPSPGNKEGGLSNIVEKSLGAVAKGGSSTLNEVVDYAERIHGPGLAFMNTPGYDPVSLTGLAAGGVNLIAFTTGRGSAIGFPIVPVLKIASNTAMYRRLKENMDLNAGRIADGAAEVGEVGQEILDLLMRVASGERTRSEVLGHQEFVPWRIGPVL
ncbi:MAG: altronate dehydratase [Candidatus Solibacter usitatus]|nr:altronate dehydratase [Candidatus Solibacter usitatus]